MFPIGEIGIRTRLFRLCRREQIAHAQQRVVIHLPAAAVHFLDQIECQPRQVPVGRSLPAFAKGIGFQRLLAALAPVSVQQTVVIALKGQCELDEPFVLRAHARRVHRLPDDVLTRGRCIESRRNAGIAFARRTQRVIGQPARRLALRQNRVRAVLAHHLRSDRVPTVLRQVDSGVAVRPTGAHVLRCLRQRRARGQHDGAIAVGDLCKGTGGKGEGNKGQ